MFSRHFLITFAFSLGCTLVINNNITNNRSNSYVKSGNIKRNEKFNSEAIIEFTQAIEINPRNISALFYRGVARRDIEDYSGAIADFNKALEINPKSPSVLYQRALTKAKLKDLTGEISDYDKLIQINPIQKDLFGNLFLNNKVNPFFADAYLNRGLAKQQLGNINGACLDWGESFQLGFKYAQILLNKNCK